MGEVLLLFYLNSIEKSINRKESKMFNFIADNDVNGVLEFLETVDDINMDFIAGQTFINSATEHDQYVITKALLEKGANPNILTDTWCCPLVNAVCRKNRAMVELLLKYDAKINILYLFFDKLIEYQDENLMDRFLNDCSYEQLNHLMDEYPGMSEGIGTKITKFSEMFDGIKYLRGRNIGLWGILDKYLI